MNNLMSRLNTRNARKIMRMFGKKKSNRGIVSASILGIGLTGATVYGMIKNRNNGHQQEMKGIDNLISSLNIGKNGQTPNLANLASLAEFSQELLLNKNEQNHHDHTPKQ